MSFPRKLAGVAENGVRSRPDFLDLWRYTADYMSICRHVLLRAYIPRHVITTLHIARRPLSRALPLSRPKLYASGPSEVAPSGEGRGVQQDADSARDDGTRAPGAGEEGWGRVERVKRALLPSWLVDETAQQTEAEGETSNSESKESTPDTGEDPLVAYIAQRRQGNVLFHRLGDSPHKIFEVLEAATRKRRTDVIQLLVVDVVENGHLLGPQLRVGLIERLLLLTEKDLLAKKQALTLLESVQSFTQLVTIPEATRLTVAAAILAMPRNPTLDSRLLDMLALLLLDYMNRVSERARANPQPTAMSLRATSVMYLLTYDLAALGLQRRSLDIVNSLVHINRLSPYAIQKADLSSGDFARIVLFALVRSSTSWGWRRLSTALIERVLPTMNLITPDVGELAVEVLRSQVTDTRDKTIESATAIVVQLMERCPGFKIPQPVLQDFYVGAERHRCPELAEMVYSVSQSDLVRKYHKHAYLPPDKGTLRWFLRYLTDKQKHTHLARVLASQLVDENIPIALQFRAPVIAILAAQGFASQARALWERYADSKEPEVVVGNAAAMLRLVSLFVSLSKRSESSILKEGAPPSAVPVPDVVDAAVASMVREESEEPSLGGSSGTSSPIAGLTHSGGAQDWSSASLQPNVVGEDESGIPCTQVTERSLLEELTHACAIEGDPKVVNEDVDATRASGGDLPVESDPSQPLSAETTETEASDEQAELSGLHADEAKRKGSDFREFAERVFNTFRRSRAPYKGAHHWELTAMARASFMLGHLEEGLDVFRYFFRARKVPDMYDINVALAVLAEHNPPAAARVIERMIRMGLEPDAVSFGSVIHHAVLRGDMPLVSALIRRSREVGVRRLSYKTVGTLLHAGVTLPDEDGRVSPRAQLQSSSDLVDSLLQAGTVPSPRMGRDCVAAALRADDSEMAFRFWRLLVKDKVQWDDEAQARTRQLIAKRIQKHYVAGRVDETQARSMLRELKERLVPLGGAGTEAAATDIASETRDD
ncbi:uncharacterized protein B0H18DRAFT_1119400 [Fomitopsis serialis]|uniref:uncharacterized protein n=1 Tax=Fomitopsis serialis TaxID=139415 RepID=UPI002008CCCF|nr:uncharacterized protein B0H18DRAFT_1119400 [Neoantrodia serialis]KAH9925559.1 hypothetical protein B0H18DRAFT_1119400 [Neoantrodia serialis]